MTPMKLDKVSVTYKYPKEDGEHFIPEQIKVIIDPEEEPIIFELYWAARSECVDMSIDVTYKRYN